jgi:hypothetical protein
VPSTSGGVQREVGLGVAFAEIRVELVDAVPMLTSVGATSANAAIAGTFHSVAAIHFGIGCSVRSREGEGFCGARQLLIQGGKRGS